MTIDCSAFAALSLVEMTNMEEVFPLHHKSDQLIFSRMNLFLTGVSKQVMLDGHLLMKEGGVFWTEAKGWCSQLFVSKLKVSRYCFIPPH
jgi:hypothetical protein